MVNGTLSEVNILSQPCHYVRMSTRRWADIVVMGEDVIDPKWPSIVDEGSKQAFKMICNKIVKQRETVSGSSRVDLRERHGSIDNQDIFEMMEI